ncbi:MAG: glycosyl transferase family protein [Acidobacteria bacterium]|nr:glycosyl transferase family protein [Acidobacteriota bacterium]
MGLIPLLDWLNRAVWCLFAPTCAWILLSGLDDLFITAAWLGIGAWRRFGRANSDAPPAAPETPRAIAIFVPLWREHRVIGQMVETNSRAIRYPNYHFFIGVYCNDEPTLQVVRSLEARFPHVHLAVVERPGPTSKADCLNQIHQYLEKYEQRHRRRFDIVMIHDAEDVIHPSSLKLINQYSTAYDMIQIPVLPLATSAGKFTHGVYCDEFAEFQSKDVAVRGWLGGFLPSNGVGTGFVRSALEKLAEEDGRIFNPGSLTEDYEVGFRLHRLGFRQTFLPIQFEQEQPVATREYFPASLGRAIRQRTRWITGICLQGWEHHGWRSSRGQLYWFWRDRKGLLGNLIGIVANLLFAYGLVTLAVSRLAGIPWSLGPRLANSAFSGVILITLSMQAIAMASRCLLVARIYGWGFAAWAPLRTIHANAINCTATILAVRDYVRARRTGQTLRWRKTEHAYPMKEVSIETAWLHPHEVDVRAAHALPAHVSRRWQVLPFRVVSGNLFLASPEQPDETMRCDVRRFTRLEIHLRRVSRENFEELARRLL